MRGASTIAAIGLGVTLVTGCGAASAPTPQIVYVYVTPAPTAVPSVPPTPALTPTQVPTPRLAMERTARDPTRPFDLSTGRVRIVVYDPCASGMAAFFLKPLDANASKDDWVSIRETSGSAEYAAKPGTYTINVFAPGCSGWSITVYELPAA